MSAPFIKLLKVWLVVLTAWLGLITVVIVISAATLANLSFYDPKVMSTEWSGNFCGRWKQVYRFVLAFAGGRKIYYFRPRMCCFLFKKPLDTI